MKYITFIDPFGATMGYGGSFVPISHRVLYENKMFHGFESVQKLFPSHGDLISVLTTAVAQPHGATGTFGNLAWSVECL